MHSNAALAFDTLPDGPDRQSPAAAIHVVPGRNVSDLSDADLLTSTRGLVGRSNQLFAALLAHLAEVEARGLHRLRACASLYTYCIYELRFSEDAAFRRVSAARLVRRFPVLLDAIDRGELHLTGLLMLGPHLTPANHVEVLARAKHRTKKELAKLVRLLDPLPDAPARIEPLGPALARSAPANPSWEQVVQSMNPVRELNPGDRPRDWIDGALALEAVNDASEHAPARIVPSRDAESPDVESEHAPARIVSPIAGPQRYRVQFTASEEYIDLVERAKALLSDAAPNVGLDALHLRAMRALVADLEKRKYAVKSTPAAKRVEPRASDDKPRQRRSVERSDDKPRQRGSVEPSDDKPRQRGSVEPSDDKPRQGGSVEPSDDKPRQRGRTIPAAVKRAVFERDEGRCSYVDSHTGQRCREIHHLELHHQTAYARGGRHTASNLTLRCTAHNTLAAEVDFGREFIADRKDALRHEPCEKQGTPVRADDKRSS